MSHEASNKYFLTKLKDVDQAGERIEAKSFEDAEQQAALLGVEVLGEINSEWSQAPV